MKLLNKKLLFLSILFLVTTLVSFNAEANMLDQVADKAKSIFKDTKAIILIFGGFGIVGIAYWAIFGKVKWSWLAGLSVGLAVLAAAGGVAQYLAGSDSASISGGGSNLFDIMAARATTFADGFRKIAFVLSGFGIIMFTFLAICGKINFKHLGYISICLFFLSGTGLLITYVSGKDVELGGFSSPGNFTKSGAGDTFSSFGG